MGRASHNGVAALVTARLRGYSTVGLLSQATTVGPLRDALHTDGITTDEAQWTWGRDARFSSRPDVLVVCEVPTAEDEWRAFVRLRQDSEVPIVGVQELLMRVSPLTFVQDVFEYYTRPIGELAPYYLGHKEFQPIKRSNSLLPLAGKSVIEFGPFEGAATAGLVAADVGRLIASKRGRRTI